ncbi:MAG TPA: hypothetical protein VKU85_00955, partial [bacterium]|nr:hypothetical protein [bacterium]
MARLSALGLMLLIAAPAHALPCQDYDRQLRLITDFATPGSARDVVELGDYLLVADAAAGIQIVDASDPSAPAIVGGLALPSSAEAVATNGQYAYVAIGNDGIAVVDVSNPAAPSLVTTLDTP